MNARWLIAKYMPDLTRREPVNVGVVLYTDDGVLSRFRAERDGKIDGRSARWAGSLDNYKAWTDYWSELTAGRGAASWDVLLHDRPESNYVVEVGGERLFGNDATDPHALLDRLYAWLVDDEPSDTALSAAELSESLISGLPIAARVQRNYRLELPTPDIVMFDYRYDNGRVNLMQSVSLTLEGARSWSALHAAAWSFEQAKNHPVDPHRGQRAIGLVKLRPEDGELGRQLEVLDEQVDEVIDVGDEDAAASRLSVLLTA